MGVFLLRINKYINIRNLILFTLFFSFVSNMNLIYKNSKYEKYISTDIQNTLGSFISISKSNYNDESSVYKTFNTIIQTKSITLEQFQIIEKPYYDLRNSLQSFNRIIYVQQNDYIPNKLDYIFNQLDIINYTYNKKIPAEIKHIDKILDVIDSIISFTYRIRRDLEKTNTIQLDDNQLSTFKAIQELNNYWYEVITNNTGNTYINKIEFKYDKKVKKLIDDLSNISVNTYNKLYYGF